MFEDYMKRAETWEVRAQSMITAFKQQSGDVSIR